MWLRVLPWLALVSACEARPSPTGDARTLPASAPLGVTSSPTAGPLRTRSAGSATPEVPGLTAGAACPTTPGASARCAQDLECFETDRQKNSGVCATLVSVSDVIGSERSRFVGSFIGLRDVTIEEYGVHCTLSPGSGPKHCGTHLRINDASGYLFLKGISGEGHQCTFRKGGSGIEGKRCYPKPGRYVFVVGKLTRRGIGWGTLEVAGLR